METKHIILECHSEFDSFLVAIPMGPENIELLNVRAMKARDLKGDLEDFADIAFRFYDFSVYQNVDPEEFGLVAYSYDLQDLPEGLPEPARIDFGQMVVDGRDFWIRFGIKYIPGIHETSSLKAER